MKKLSRIAALLAASALLFGFAACSGGSSDDGGEKDPDGDQEQEQETGASVSYDFAELSEADFTTLGVTVTGSNDIKIATANTAATPYMVLGGKVGIVTTVANKLSVKPKEGAPLAIGFNTNGLNRAVNDTTTVGQTVQIDHFITYPVESGKKYQMAVTSGGPANNTSHYFVVTDTNGKILASKVCTDSTTDAVTLDAFTAEENVVRLSLHRSNSSGTSYVGKVTLTEITTEVKITGITVTAPEGSDNKVTINKTLQLTSTVAPENATSSSVTWSSSDEAKAKVDATGKVTGISAGEVTITATAADGSNVTGTIALTVIAGEDTVTPAEITITNNGENVTKTLTCELGTTQITAAGVALFEELKTDEDELLAYGIVAENTTTNVTISSVKITAVSETSVALKVIMSTTAAADTTGTLTVALPATITTAEGEVAVTANGQAISKTVSYTAEAPTGAVTYTIDVSDATFENIVKDTAETPSNPTTGDITINGLKFYVSENKGKDLPDTQNSLKVINMAGAVSKSKNYVKFTTTKAATVKVTFFHGTADRHAKIISETDSTGQTGTEATTADKALKVTTLTLSDAGTYYLGGDNGIYITKIELEM